MAPCSVCAKDLEDSCFTKTSLMRSSKGLRVSCLACSSVFQAGLVKCDRRTLARETRSQKEKNRRAEVSRERGRLRDARMEQATPVWVKKEWFREIYRESSRRSTADGVEYHVDHIIPIAARKVCGLNVPWNLQIILGTDNLSKNNSFSPKQFAYCELFAEPYIPPKASGFMEIPETP